jgi:hypothetical protein
MRELRPDVVLVGPNVKPLDYVLLRRAAMEVDATIVQLGPLIARHRLAEWLSNELESARMRRTGTNGSGRG